MCKVFCNYAHLWLEFIVNYYQYQDFGTASKHETRVFKSNHYLYPFSQRELDRNKILTQNYGW